MSLSTLPLQDMIAAVVKTASDRLVSSERTTAKIKAAAADMCEACNNAVDDCVCEAEEEKTARASFTEPSFVMKLASACDYISQNVDNIAPPNRGVLGTALAKLAENGLPAQHGVSMPPTNPEGALEVTTPENGEQQYKKDKPKTEDAAASQADTPLGKAREGDGSTQVDNDMHSAPGQETGSVPTATYPEDGPFHSGGGGGEKTAGRLGAIAGAAKRGLGRAGELLAGGKKQPFAGPGSGGRALGKVMDKRPGNSMTALKQTTGAGTEARKSLGTRAAAGGIAIGGVGAGLSGKDKGKKKTAAELARELILNKLAGEDVMQANISADGSGGPLVGDGELEALESGNRGPDPNAGSGYGNDQRSLIASNDAAIGYTKGDAKKPQGRQMSEVLTEPAFSPEHDSKLREQLRNAGEAGVKIARAAVVPFLKQAAASGILTQETVNAFKAKQKTASDQATTQGAASSGDAAVSKLRTLMDAQRKSKASMGDIGGGGGVY